MSNDNRIREALRRWIAETSGKVSADELGDGTPLFRSGVLKSVQVTDLILFIEELIGHSIDVERIKPGAFRDIDTICRSFLGSGHA